MSFLSTLSAALGVATSIRVQNLGKSVGNLKFFSVSSSRSASLLQVFGKALVGRGIQSMSNSFLAILSF